MQFVKKSERIDTNERESTKIAPPSPSWKMSLKIVKLISTTGPDGRTAH
jgi:hypothetical protein